VYVLRDWSRQVDILLCFRSFFRGLVCWGSERFGYGDSLVGWVMGELLLGVLVVVKEGGWCFLLIVGVYCFWHKCWCILLLHKCWLSGVDGSGALQFVVGRV